MLLLRRSCINARSVCLGEHCGRMLFNDCGRVVFDDATVVRERLHGYGN